MDKENGADGMPAAEQEESQTEDVAVAEDVNGDDLVLLLEDARNKADENWDQLVRAKAELENLRKRHQRDLESAHKFALEKFVAELLAVHDSMELGLSAAQDEGADLDKLREGSELTIKLFNDVMERFGVAEISPEGEPFNPDLHQAMSMQPQDDVPANTVLAVMQKGYTLNGRLVRPAMVVVSQPNIEKIDEQA
jgi:molecular chaperone GrpE